MMVFYPALSITNEKWYHTAHEESFEHAKILRSQHQCHPCLLRWMELGNSCSLQDHGLVSAVWLSMFSRVLCHETFERGQHCFTMFHLPYRTDHVAKTRESSFFCLPVQKKKLQSMSWQDFGEHTFHGHDPWPNEERKDVMFYAFQNQAWPHGIIPRKLVQ